MTRDQIMVLLHSALVDRTSAAQAERDIMSIVTAALDHDAANRTELLVGVVADMIVDEATPVTRIVAALVHMTMLAAASMEHDAKSSGIDVRRIVQHVALGFAEGHTEGDPP